MPTSSFHIRPARTADVHAIQSIREPFLGKVLLKHELVSLFEKIQEFLVVTDENDRVVAAGALHVMWQDLAEVRSVVVDQTMRGQGIGHLLVDALLDKARDLGVTRVFCLTFETEFFAKHGFEPISDVPVDADTFEEMTRSTDLGVAEFLDLARVKENTLGNTRMLRLL
jgi:amino-acid N-acetyltransferase